MVRYRVVKLLELEFECEASSEDEARQKCIDSNDMEFTVLDCQYEVTNLDEED